MSMNLNKIDFSDAVDFDIRDLTHASDSIKIGDGTEFLAINADGSINITDNSGSLTVDATDFDIRDLSASQDNVAISDGTDTLAINGDGSINSVVTATDLDIRDLAHTQDSIQLGNGSVLNTFTTTGPKNAVDVHLAGTDVTIDTDDDLADTAIESKAYTATSTQGDILAAAQLASRKHMFVQNLGSQDVFVGKPGVTTANGLRLFKNNTLTARIGPALALHAVTASGTADMRIMELS
jgi:hypothetical protein